MVWNYSEVVVPVRVTPISGCDPPFTPFASISSTGCAGRSASTALGRTGGWGGEAGFSGDMILGVHVGTAAARIPSGQRWDPLVAKASREPFGLTPHKHLYHYDLQRFVRLRLSPSVVLFQYHLREEARLSGRVLRLRRDTRTADRREELAQQDLAAAAHLTARGQIFDANDVVLTTRRGNRG